MATVEEGNEPSKDVSADGIYDGFGIFERENQAMPLSLSESHTVLFELPLPTDETLNPIPLIGEDKWNGNHVKLPSSPSSEYSEILEDGNKTIKQRWNLIKTSLLSTEIINSRDLENAIKQYNTKFASKWNFTLLHDLFDGDFESYSEFFFSELMPKMVALALRLPELIKSPIPLLKQKMNRTISMSQEQVGCLLANAFFCTFPNRNVERKSTDYPEINFNRLFSSQGQQATEKLKCLLNYFKRICLNMPTGVITFQRRSIKPSDFPDWSESTMKFSSIKLSMSSRKTIEDSDGMLQVDFANRYLGGGVLGWGCVQEEIRFVINPELIAGMLFCESMNSEEAIVISGCEQFNNYTGYAKTFTWAGNFYDSTPRDSVRRKKIHIVAIDATPFHKPHQQFIDFMLKRETNKAFVGFYHDPKDETVPIPIASGNWGCGAFRGNAKLKALLQLAACCANRRNLFYCTFGDKELVHEVNTMFEFLKSNEITIGELWKFLKAFRENMMTDQPDKLYAFIYKEHARQNELAKGLESTSLKEIVFASSEETSVESLRIVSGSVSEDFEENSTSFEIPPSKKFKIGDDDTVFDDESQKSLEDSVDVLNKNVHEIVGEMKTDLELTSDLPVTKSIDILKKKEEFSGVKKITDFFKRST